MKKEKTTLTTIAKISGVSKATVSRVLNNSAAVSEDIKLKVNQAVRQSGYTKKNTKLQISLTISKIIIISVDDITIPHSFYGEILEGLQTETRKLGIDLELILFSQIMNNETLADDLIRSQAVILIGMDNPWVLGQLKLLSIPTVIINGSDPEMKISSISPDYEFGGFLAANELIKNGHKKIKLMTVNIKHSIFQRSDGFSRAIELSGLKFDSSFNIIDLAKKAEELYPDSDLHDRIVNNKAGLDFGAKEILPRLIDEGYFSDCTAVFCVCDMMAISLIDALRNKGINVPKDISIIGFDDLEISSMTSPKLTTIGTDYKILSKSAIHNLIETVNHKNNVAVRSNVAVHINRRDSIKNIN